MSELFKKVDRFVRESFNDEGTYLHSKRTVHWIKVLKPDADEALLIAGMSHDIERAFRDKGGIQDRRMKEYGFQDEELLLNH